MCVEKTVRLFVDSSTRDGGSTMQARFLLPAFNGEFSRYKRCFLTVERFLPLKISTDVDEVYVLRLTGGGRLSNTYDSVLKSLRGGLQNQNTSSDVIAVQSQPHINNNSSGAATYHTMTMPIDGLELGNVLGSEIELTLSSVKAVNGVTMYAPAGSLTADPRDWYAVIKLEFRQGDDELA